MKVIKKYKILIIVVGGVILLIGGIFYLKNSVFICSENLNEGKIQDNEIQDNEIQDSSLEDCRTCPILSTCKTDLERICLNLDGNIVYSQGEENVVYDKIPDKVVDFAVAMDHAKGERRVLALTDKGEIYYSGEGNSFKPLTFIPIESSQKIVRIYAGSTPVEQVECYEREEFFAEMETGEKWQLQSKLDEIEESHGNIGKPVKELYPFKNAYLSILGEDFRYYVYADKKVALGDENNFLTYNGQILLAKNFYCRRYKPFSEVHNTLKEDYLETEDGYVYAITFSRETGTNYTVRLFNPTKVIGGGAGTGFEGIDFADGAKLMFWGDDYQVTYLR